MMQTTDEISARADALLEQAGYSQYTELEFTAQWERTIVTDREIEEVIGTAETVATDTGPEVTLRDLARDCTRRQREVIRLARLLAPSARRRQIALSTLMAERIGVSRQAVHAILGRAYDRMEARYRSLARREASEAIEALWRSEMAHKRRMVYRRPSRGWISAHLWARRRRM